MKFIYKVYDCLPVVVAILLIVALFVGAVYCSHREYENHSAYSEKGDGICPVCGAELVKGVYGAYAPTFIWYCPNCP